MPGDVGGELTERRGLSAPRAEDIGVAAEVEDDERALRLSGITGTPARGDDRVGDVTGLRGVSIGVYSVSETCLE